MEIEQIGIDAHFTKPQNFEAAAELSRRRNTLYDNYIELVERIFLSYREFSEETNDPIRSNEHERSCFVQQFKEFLRKFCSIIRDTSIFQVDCLTEIKVSRDDIIFDATKAIVKQAKNLAKPQIAFRRKMEEVHSLKEEVGMQHQNLKSESNEALLYYNPKLMVGKAKAIEQRLTEIENMENSLNSEKEQISKNANEFERYLVTFRKRLLQNKYSMLQKMTEQSKNTRECLTEIMLFLSDCVNSKMQAFADLVKNPPTDSISLTQSKGRNRKGDDIDTIINNLINSIEEYNRTIDELELILKSLDKGFKHLLTKVMGTLDTRKPGFMEDLNNLYTIEESPSRQVNETLDLIQFFTTRLCSIGDKLYGASNKLVIIRQNVKKHSDITLSLLKMNQRGKSEDGRYPQIEQLYNQISYQFVVEIMQEVYQAFKNGLADIKNHFSKKYYKKKKRQVQDSMEVSHIEEDESILAVKKRPCKKELWLWRDWRDKTNYTFKPSTPWLKKLHQYVDSFKPLPESKEIGQYECMLGKRDARGVLKVHEKFLEFSSSANNISLQIPFSEIQSVQEKVRMLEKKVLQIHTEKGQIVFSKFLDIESVRACISDQLEKEAASGGGKVKKKAVVSLTPEEIKFLEDNKQEIEKRRQSLEGMQKIKSAFVDNITVDQVYDLIYSDKPFTLRGKPEDSFFAFVMKKAKNINYVAGAYDTPGPEFYTNNPESKFNTCPPFSTRINEFDHPLPPMPFMPKTCHCKETSLLFWLNSESFDYVITSTSSGAPYTDTFEVKIVHRVYKKEGGVQIEIYGVLIFVKPTGMKGMLQSKGTKEMVEGGVFTLDEIEKTLKIMAGGEEEKPEEEETAESTPAQSRSEVDRLRNQNKMLLGALVGVFLLNILLRMIMG